MKTQDEHMDTEEPLNEIAEFHNSLLPPDNLQEVIIKKLYKQELLNQKRNMKNERVFWMAATVAGILIGFFGATMLSSKASTMPVVSENQYLLLLHEDSTFIATEGDIPRLIKEYTNWAGELQHKGALIAAEKLTNETVPLGKVPAQITIPSGYFVIAASSLEEATEIANTHPHLKYNGGIEVRPIDNLKK